MDVEPSDDDQQLLDAMKSEIDQLVSDEFLNARTDQGGMFYAPSSDKVSLEKTEDVETRPRKLIVSGPMRRYRMKFKPSKTSGKNKKGGDDFTELTLSWKDHELQSLDATAIDSSIRSQEKRPRCVLLNGCAGSGKTTLARRLACTQPSETSIFVAVELPDLLAKLPTGGQFGISMVQLIAMSMCSKNHVAEHRELPDENLRRDAELLWTSRVPITWVLDGLDQVASGLLSSAPLRDLLNGFLANDNALWKLRRDDVVIVTSRDGRTQPLSSSFKDVPTLCINQWTSEQVGHFVAQRSEACQSTLLTGSLADFARHPTVCEQLCTEIERMPESAAVDESAVVARVFEKVYTLDANRKLRGLEPDVGYTEVVRFATFLARRYHNGPFNLDIDAASTQEEKASAKALVHSGFVRAVTEGDGLRGSTYAFIDDSMAGYFAAQPATLPPSVSRAVAKEEGDGRRAIQQEWLSALLAWLERELSRNEEQERESRRTIQEQEKDSARAFWRHESWVDFLAKALEKRPLKGGFYTVEDDKAVKRFSAAGRYNSAQVTDVRERVGTLYKTKFMRYGSVTRAMDASEEDDRMLSDNIFTTLTLVELTNKSGDPAADDWVVVDSTEASPDGSPTSPSSASSDGTEVTRFEATSIMDGAIRCASCREQKRVDSCPSCRRLLAVEGRAGIGKSTFAMQLSRVQPSESCVFVMLSLGSLESFLPTDKTGDADLSMLQLLGIAMSPFTKASSSASSDVHALKDVHKDLIESLWGSPHIPIVWVLDGLDEVSEGSDPRIKELLAQILEPKSSFWDWRTQDAVIVTSREEKGFFGQYLSGKPMLRIDTWGPTEVERYVGSYFRTGSAAAVSSQKASKKKATDVLLSTALGSFARLPITCELVCFVIQQTKADTVPDVAYVYERAVEEIYKNNKSRRALAAAPVAADDPTFHSVDFSAVRDFASDFGLQIARRFQSGNVGGNGNGVGLLVVDIPKKDDLSFSLVYSGWLRHVTGDNYLFVHKSFMEYFAARALATSDAQLKSFKVSVGQAAQQRNLLVLLATILVRAASTCKASIRLLERAVAVSFRRLFRAVEKTVERRMEADQHHRDEMAVLRDQVGCSTISEIAKVLFCEVPACKSLSAEQVAAYSTLSSPTFPPLKELECDLMEGIDLCAGPARRLKRLFKFTDVPIFYAWMIQPMAQQNALRPLMYAQRRICGNKDHFEALKALRVYDAALLEAEVVGAKDTAHFLMTHCEAKIDLKLAAEIGAVTVLRRDLPKSADKGVLTEVLMSALRFNQAEAAAAILRVSFGCWSKEMPPHAALVDVVCHAWLAGADLESDALLSTFAQQAEVCINSESRALLLPAGFWSPQWVQFPAKPVLFVARAVRANHVSLDGENLDSKVLRELKELAAPSLSFRRCPLEDNSAVAFSSMNTLTNLDLSDVVKFGDAGLAALLPSQSLRSLRLGGTAVTHAGVLRAAQLMCRLQHLIIPADKGSAVKTFSATENTSIASKITSLELQNVSQEAVGALFELRHFPHLESILLNGSPVTDAHLAFLVPCSELRLIDLRETAASDPSLLTKDRCHALAALQKLQLELPAEPAASGPSAGELLPHIRWMLDLTSICLTTHVTVETLCSIGEAHQVTDVKMSDFDSDALAGAGLLLESLHRVFPQMRALDLSGVAVKDPMIPALVPCEHLETLDLCNTRVENPSRFVNGAAQELLKGVTLVQAASGGYSSACQAMLDRLSAPDTVAKAVDVLSYTLPPNTVTSNVANAAEEDVSDDPVLKHTSWTPLFYAVLNGHAAVCNTLIAAGADVNRRDVYGCTPLHVAVACHELSVMEVLFSHGANVDGGVLSTSEEKAVVPPSPLHIAVRCGYFDICQDLIGQGADVDIRDGMGATPLHHAVSSDDSLVFPLLDAGADKNCLTDDGWSPLLLAARNGRKFLFMSLLGKSFGKSKSVVCSLEAKNDTDYFSDSQKRLIVDKIAIDGTLSDVTGFISLVDGSSVLNLDGSPIDSSALAAVALWVATARPVTHVSLRNTSLGPLEVLQFLAILENNIDEELLSSRSEVTIDLTGSAIYSVSQRDDELERLVQSLSERAQIIVPLPEKPFVVDGEPVLLSDFSGVAPLLMLDLPGISLNTHEFDESCSSAERASEIKEFVEMLAVAQRKPIGKRGGARAFAGFFHAKLLGGGKLLVVTEDYGKLAQQGSMSHLSDFMNVQLTESVKYPAKALVNIALQIGELCEYLHSQDLVLVRIVPSSVALDERRNLIRYLDIRSIVADGKPSSPGWMFNVKCEDPNLARTQTATKCNDIYALGMFLLFLVCYRPDFKRVVFRFPNVSPENAQCHHDDATKHYTKLLESTFSGKDELIAKIALLLTDCMKPEVAADKVLIQRPTIREFNERLQEIHELL